MALGQYGGNQYQHPLIDAQKVKSMTGLSMPSSYTLIAELERLGVVEEITGAKRGKNYGFSDYINLFK